MKIITDKGKGKVKLTDKHMSAIMSGLAVATMYWDKLADPEVTVSREDLLNTSWYLLKTYAKSAGVSEEEVAEAIERAAKGYKE